MDTESLNVIELLLWVLHWFAVPEEVDISPSKSATCDGSELEVCPAIHHRFHLLKP